MLKLIAKATLFFSVACPGGGGTHTEKCSEEETKDFFDTKTLKGEKKK